jgi:hypothetical protein
MRHFSEIGLKPWRIFLPTLSLLLALAVACGSAAPPEPVVEERAVEKKAEVVEEVEKVVVATPAPAPAQPEAEVNPGKLTIMVGDLSNERFDPLFAVGGHGGQTYGKIVHGSLISTDERLRPLPGIASQWGLSADGLT